MVHTGSFRVLFIFVAVWVSDSVINTSRVELVNNGYVNLVVAIKPSTPKIQAEIIISNIKVIIIYKLLFSFSYIYTFLSTVENNLPSHTNPL